MIISRTPFRISFVGGGTDLRSFYAEEPGQVLSTSIDKYIYVVVKRQIGIVEYKYRVNWSKVEFRNSINNSVSTNMNIPCNTNTTCSDYRTTSGV